MIGPVTPFAGGMFGAAQAASTARVQNAGKFSEVLQAQAESAKADEAKAEMEAHNARGINSLAAQGMQMTMHTHTSDYKESVLAKVNGNNDGWVSMDELSAQTSKAGGSDEETAALYKLMDMDSDGKVSGKEFMDSIPDPFSTEAFVRRRETLMRSESMSPEAIGKLYRSHGDMINTDAMLAGLGRDALNYYS